MFRRLGVAVAIVAATAGSTQALQRTAPKPSLYVFGGAMLSGTFPGWTNIPFAGGLDGNYIAGFAYDRRLFDLGGGFDVGVELGLASRFGPGERTDLEGWVGASFRYNHFKLGHVHITPGVVIGFSAVTASIGTERKREADVGGNATLLPYLGPELAFRSDRHPNVELVVRTHHRSGAFGTFGNMHEGANATLVGLRFTFD